MEGNPPSLSCFPPRASQGSTPSLCVGKLHYLVECAGYQSNKDQTSWEPANHLQNSNYLVQDFHTTYPHKPCHS
ncbi:uncharacterized protein VP01_2222g1 [Puccinia sorghi]|uniref:Chromo domain-containing protein n=1 Tax=Puccinia sorghi TaxID=27349 RepID=A0A0L6V8M4_9BASI|nr:uncharacterized protein VP01_2222g1 [Puccinia sorghi]